MYNLKKFWIRIFSNYQKVFLLPPLIVQAIVPNYGTIDDFQYLRNYIPYVDRSLVKIRSSKAFNTLLLNPNASNNLSPEEIQAKIKADIQKEIAKQEDLFKAPNCKSTTIKKVAAVGFALGMSKNMILGILGNISVESGFDPTKIETIFSEVEPFKIGPMKKMAISDISKFTISVLRENYISSNCKIPYVKASDKYIMEAHTPKNINFTLNVEEYLDEKGGFCPGIGLFGFTGPVGTALQEYAKSKHMNWYDVDCQLAFIIDPEGFSKVKGYNWLKHWLKGSKENISIEKATDDWNVNFEGSKTHFKTDLKIKKAKKLEKTHSKLILPNFYYSKKIFEIAEIN